jgi:predicted histidine transporter YuiF (NhaC family)
MEVISHRESYMKRPSIEVSALVVSAIITLAIGEWWHLVPVIAAIVVVHVSTREVNGQCLRRGFASYAGRFV